FAPNYSWSALFTKNDEATLLIGSETSGTKIDFVIYPLGGGVIPGFIPLQGGRNQGFLVANKNLVYDLGGNVFVNAIINKTTVEALPYTIRQRVQAHPRYSGPKNPIYFAVEPYYLDPYDFEIEFKKRGLKAVNELWEMYMNTKNTLEHYITQLASERADAEKLERKALRRSIRYQPPPPPQ
ncbi:MAG: hypothetical protein QXZ17_16065, partial [Nitrososphaerota archaeon]